MSEPKPSLLRIGSSDEIMSGFLIILLAHAASTFCMVGIIWFVQIVHYPLFANVGREDFIPYEALHTRSTSFVVIPPMMMELATTVLLLVFPIGRFDQALAWLGAALLVAVWMLTFLGAVPCHRRLGSGFNHPVHQRLLRINGWRTFFWTARAVVVLTMLWQAMTTS